jgi:adenylate cyclase
MRRRGRRHARLVALVLCGVLAGTLALLADAAGVFDRPEHAAVDARFDIRGEQGAPREVAVVQIDDKTFDALEEQWPFRRSLHGQVLDRLTRAGARTVVFDIQFTEPTTEEEDNALIDAVDRSHDVVLATTEVDSRGRSNVFGGDDILREIGARAGNAGIDQDSDGVIRRFQGSIEKLATLPTVATEMATRRQADFPEGEQWIDFAGPPGTVKTYSYSDVLRGRVPPGAFRDRIVIVGASTPSLQDVHQTSSSGRELMSGAEVVANEATTILRGFPLRSSAGWVDGLLILGLGLVAPLGALRLSPIRVLLLAGGLGLAYLVAAQLLFNGGHVLPVVAPLTALALGLLGALGISAFFGALDRERTRLLFSRFAPQAVVDEVLAHADGDVRLGGVRREVSILFCDLRGSTAFLEQIEPEPGIEVVNRYLTEMSDAIMAHGGTLAGYRGDGIFAIFGAPLAQPDHAKRAYAAALEMTSTRLDSFNAWLREQGHEGFRMGVGICTGEAMAGNVGSEERMEYTAIGDTTNVAARLEAMTKGTPHMVFVSDSTREGLGDGEAGLELVGDLEVRGRAKTVRVWAPEQT